MKIRDIPVPEVFKESADFRFFLKWFDYALTKTQFDITNLADLYDPLRCPKDLLWMLGDTMGYKYDDRLCAAFNRFAMLFFMSLIKYKGSKTGVTLAAEVNLKQHDINAYGEEKEILYNRLEDTSIPVNSVYVDSNVDDGYINVVYFSNKTPVDSCIEYVRPLGMYCFQYAGVRVDTATKISVDARLANASDITGTIGPTRIGHYTRDDYARMQKMSNEEKMYINSNDVREKVYARSSTVEKFPTVDARLANASDITGTIGPTRIGHYTRDDYARMQKMNNEEKMTINSKGTREKVYARSSTAEKYPTVDAGYRALNSLQLANNNHIVKALINVNDPMPDMSNPLADDSNHYKVPDVIFAQGITQVGVDVPDDIRMSDPKYNLLYDKTTDEKINPAVYTSEPGSQEFRPIPRVNDEFLGPDGKPLSLVYDRVLEGEDAGLRVTEDDEQRRTQ